MNYEPEPGAALVKLIPRYSGVKVPEKTYDSCTSGEIITVNDGWDELDPTPKPHRLIGRIGCWEQYKDGVRPGEGYAFIKLTDIYGSSNATNTTSNN